MRPLRSAGVVAACTRLTLRWASGQPRQRRVDGCRLGMVPITLRHCAQRLWGEWILNPTAPAHSAGGPATAELRKRSTCVQRAQELLEQVSDDVQARSAAPRATGIVPAPPAGAPPSSSAAALEAGSQAPARSTRVVGWYRDGSLPAGNCIGTVRAGPIRRLRMGNDGDLNSSRLGQVSRSDRGSWPVSRRRDRAVSPALGVVSLGALSPEPLQLLLGIVGCTF